MEAEQASLTGEKDALEMEKTGIKEELVRVEQEKMDLDTEKMGKCRKVISGRHVKGGYILDTEKMGRCRKIINGRHVKGGYVLDMEKMGRCTTHCIKVITAMIGMLDWGGGGYIVTVDIKMMGRCIKVINGRHIRGGYVRDIEKMSRCTVQFHNSLHTAISNKRIG